MGNGLPWTDEGDKLATRLYAEGYHCGDIAKAVSRVMHKVTASAVEARLSRLGVYRPKISAATFWTPDRIELMKKLYAEGLSCSEIARRLGGGCSRNSVIGKVHRLKLPLRAAVVKVQKTKPARPAPPKPVTQVRKIAALVAEPLPPANQNDVARVKSLFDLESHHCRWPVDVAGQKYPGYCGDQKVIGLSYCEGHVRRAFHVGQSRQSKVAQAEVEATRLRQEKQKVDA